MSGDSYKIMFNDKLTDIAELKVMELKAELKKRGVSTTGNKQELYEKLKNVRQDKKNFNLLDNNDNKLNNKIFLFAQNSIKFEKIKLL